MGFIDADVFFGIKSLGLTGCKVEDHQVFDNGSWVAYVRTEHEGLFIESEDGEKAEITRQFLGRLMGPALMKRARDSHQ